MLRAIPAVLLNSPPIPPALDVPITPVPVTVLPYTPVPVALASPYTPIPLGVVPYTPQPLPAWLPHTPIPKPPVPLLIPRTAVEKAPGNVFDTVPLNATALPAVLLVVPLIALLPAAVPLLVSDNKAPLSATVLALGNSKVGLGYVPARSPPAGPLGGKLVGNTPGASILNVTAPLAIVGLG